MIQKAKEEVRKGIGDYSEIPPVSQPASWLCSSNIQSHLHPRLLSNSIPFNQPITPTIHQIPPQIIEPDTIAILKRDLKTRSKI